MVTTARQELQSVGVMSVGWMAFVGVVITIEKHLPRERSPSGARPLPSLPGVNESVLCAASSRGREPFSLVQEELHGGGGR